MNLPVIPHDKCLHAIYGAAAAFVGIALMSMPAGALLCLGAAAGKEVYDKWRGGTPDAIDFAATLIGGGFVCAAAVLG